MTAPSIKSGTGHAALSVPDFSTMAAPDLYTNGTNSGSNAGYYLGSNATGTGRGYFIGQSSAVAGTYYGRKQTVTAVSSNATGTVILIHTMPYGFTYSYNLDTVANSSILVTLRSTAGNDRSWVVDGSDHASWTAHWRPLIIDPRYTTTQYGSNGTLNCASIAQLEFHAKMKTGGNGYLQHYFGGGYLVTPYKVINGTSADPGSISTIATAIDAAYLEHLPRAGTTVFNLYFSYHGGDGTTASYISETGRTFIFPPTSSVASKFMRAHIPAGHLGLQFEGSGASTYLLTNCIVSGPHYLNMNAVSGDTCTLSGCTFSDGATVTLSAYTTITSCVFSNYVMIDLSSSPTINSMTVSSTQSTYAVDVGARTSLSNITFNALGSSDYAIKLTPTATASFTVTNCTFSGYATGKKIYVNDSNAAHTITISGSGIASADITSAGATIVVPATTTTITHSTLQSGTRYRIYNVTTATELTNTTVSGTGFSQPYTSGITTGDTIRLTTAYQSGTTVKWGGPWTGTATVGSTLDFSSNTPDTISEFADWGIDGSTVTECSSDYVGIEVEISTGATTLDRRRIIAFIAYAMTTSSGISNWFGLLNVLDTANVEVDASVANLHITNTGATDVVLTTITLWLRRSDGAALLVSGTKSLTMEVSPVYVVSAGSGLTASESAQLMSIPTNPATATTAAAIKAKTDSLTFTVPGKVDSNILVVNGSTISGTGTADDPWGP